MDKEDAEQNTEETYIKACERKEAYSTERTVKERIKELETCLDINHFLNTRFNRQNQALYDRMMQEREKKKNTIQGANGSANGSISEGIREGISEGVRERLEGTEESRNNKE